VLLSEAAQIEMDLNQLGEQLALLERRCDAGDRGGVDPGRGSQVLFLRDVELRPDVPGPQLDGDAHRSREGKQRLFPVMIKLPHPAEGFKRLAKSRIGKLAEQKMTE